MFNLAAHDAEPYTYSQTTGFYEQDCGCNEFEYECEEALEYLASTRTLTDTTAHPDYSRKD